MGELKGFICPLGLDANLTALGDMGGLPSGRGIWVGIGVEVGSRVGIGMGGLLGRLEKSMIWVN